MDGGFVRSQNTGYFLLPHTFIHQLKETPTEREYGRLFQRCYSILSDLRRLHFLQRIRILFTVLLPPLENGII